MKINSNVKAGGRSIQHNQTGIAVKSAVKAGGIPNNHARQGTYSDKIESLDIRLQTPKYFTVGTIQAGSTGDLQDSWSLTMTRAGASAGYGAYTVTFTHDGYDGENSTIDEKPAINPMQT